MECKINCCCNCDNQKQLMKHPGNVSEWARGKMSESFGYVCMMQFEDGSNEGEAYFFDAKHDICEFHNPKPQINDNANKD